MAQITKSEASKKIKDLDIEIESIEDKISYAKNQTDKQSLQSQVNDLIAEREYYLEFI